MSLRDALAAVLSAHRIDLTELWGGWRVECENFDCPWPATEGTRGECLTRHILHVADALADAVRAELAADPEREQLAQWCEVAAETIEDGAAVGILPGDPQTFKAIARLLRASRAAPSLKMGEVTTHGVCLACGAVNKLVASPQSAPSLADEPEAVEAALIQCPNYDGTCAGHAGHEGNCGNAASFRLRGLPHFATGEEVP